MQLKTYQKWLKRDCVRLHNKCINSTCASASCTATGQRLVSSCSSRSSWLVLCWDCVCWECVSIVFWSLDRTVLKSDAEGMVGSTPTEQESIINLSVCVHTHIHTDRSLLWIKFYIQFSYAHTHAYTPPVWRLLCWERFNGDSWTLPPERFPTALDIQL